MDTEQENNGQNSYVNVKAELDARWKKAVQECEAKLSPSDFASIQEFDSSEALFNNLHQRQAEHGQSWHGQTGESVQYILGPIARSLDSLSVGIVVAMLPHRPSLGCLWGLLHLSVKMSLISKEIWDDFSNKIDHIQRELEILQKCAVLFPEDGANEMNTAVLQVFISLVNFWVEAVNWIRDNMLPRPPFSVLNKKFDLAIGKVQERVKHVTRLLDISSKTKGGAELLRKIELADETVQFPQFILPRAAYTSFYGREEIFKELDRILDPSSNPNNLRSALLFGMGGVGKTSTALQYAHKKPSAYDAVFWVKSETEDALKKSFTEIATSLKLPGARANGQDEQNLLYLQNWLRTQQARGETGRKWLFIFDNCENFDIINSAQVLTTSGSVIITSRYSEIGRADTNKINIRPFKADKGLVLLKSFLAQKQFTSEEDDVLESLLGKVDGLPLGIRLLAALINSKVGTLVQYPDYFKKYSRRLFAKATAPEDYQQYRKREQHVLDHVWLLSFNSLSFEAKSLLGMISFMSPEDILLSMFNLNPSQIGVETEDPSVLLICEDEFELKEAMANLITAALVDQEASLGSDEIVLSVHRLIQEAFLYNCSREERQKFFESAVRVLYTAFPKQINGRPLHGQWSVCRAVIQHAISLAERYKEFQGRNSVQSIPELGELLKNCAWYKFEMADYESALSILDIAKASCVDKKSPLYAHLLNTEHSCYFELNDLEKSRKVCPVALELRKSFAEGGDPDALEDYAVQLSNFGVLQSAEGNYDEALESFGKGEYLKAGMGEEAKISLGLTHINTGRAHFLKGDFDKAAERYQQAEKIFVEKFGVKAHFMAHLQYARGNLNVKIGRTIDGRKYYEECQDILDADESTKYHALKAATYFKIACLQIGDGSLDDALNSLAIGREIAEFRGSRGEAARIIRKQAYIYSLSQTEESKKQYESHRELADLMLLRCPKVVNFENNDEGWNRLVCGYFR